MRTIFIIMDSLNRHYLRAYGSDWVKTPNIDRLAEQGVVFENHFAGSLPCMPARREMMTGRLNFLEAPWGCIEPWDDCLPVELRKQKNVYSHLITDHYHYFHSGGEAYHTLFDTWEFCRGQEGDVWHPLVKGPEIPKFVGKNRRPYWVNRQFMDAEKDEDYPTPQCFARAMEFLDNNHDADNWHLHLEVFDPHEPFMCPSRYRELYNDTWDNRYHFDWPQYARTQEDPEAVEHIRKSYAGTLTMADTWLGKFLNKLDQYDMWKNTVVVFTTDHGHLLGEHGYWAKNYMMDYTELVHIPLIACTPETLRSGQRVKALTTTIDVMPTFMDLHSANRLPQVMGKSLLPLLQADQLHHDAVLYGYFGKDINMTNGQYTYCRQALPDSVVHHHTAMPRGFSDFLRREWLANAEVGVFLKHSYGIPVYRMERKSQRHMDAPTYNPIYNIQEDPFQSCPIQDPSLERGLAEKMKALLVRHEAPECQFKRMGF